MFRLLVGVMGIILFLGCTSKEETALMKSYTEKINYHKKLQRTEKIQLYENNVTKVMLTATYLYTPTEEKNDKRDEVFIVGVHIDEETDEKGYSLLLNGKEAKEVKVLKENDIRLKELSFISQWGDYYLLTFPHVKGKKLSLVFESEQYGRCELSFAKVAKYVLIKNMSI